MNKRFFFSYAFGAVAPRIFSFVLLPLFAYYLSQKELGIYDLLMSSVSLFAPLISLGLGDACFRFSYNNTGNESFISVKTTIIFSFFLHFFLLLGTSIFIVLYSSSIDFLSVLVIFSSSFFLLFQSFLRVFQRIEFFAFIGSLNAACILFFSVLLFYVLGKSLVCVKLAIILSNLLTLLAIIQRIDVISILKKGIFDSKALKILLKFSLPLVLNTISWWLVFFSNRFIISWTLGVEANAVFAVASKIPSILFLTNSVFIFSFQDFIFEKTAESRQIFDFTLIFNKQMIFQCTLVFVMMTLNKTLIPILFPIIYATAFQYSPLIFLGIIFTNFSSFWAIFFWAKNDTIKVLQTTLIGSLLNIDFTLFFIKSMALYAPILGTCLGFLSILLIRMYLLRFEVCIKFEKRKLLEFSFLFIFFSYLQFVSNIFLDFFAVFMSISIFTFYHFDFIKTNYKKLKMVIYKPQDQLD